MPTYSALTTLPGEDAAQGLAAAMERMDPEPTGVGVFEIEDGSGLWEVGGYFLEPPARSGCWAPVSASPRSDCSRR